MEWHGDIIKIIRGSVLLSEIEPGHGQLHVAVIFFIVVLWVVGKVGGG